MCRLGRLEPELGAGWQDQPSTATPLLVPQGYTPHSLVIPRKVVTSLSVEFSRVTLQANNRCSMQV